MAQIDEIIEIATSQIPIIRSRWEVADDLAVRYALINGIFRVLGGRNAPSIISGYRSLSKQARLHSQGRPAARFSWHTIKEGRRPAGRAIDLVSGNLKDLDIFAFYWVALGGRAGKDFKKPDRNHFDSPGPLKPIAAF